LLDIKNKINLMTSIELTQHQDHQVLKISGRLDLQVIYKQSKKVSDYPCLHTLVDMSEVEFIDSSGIGLLMNLCRHIQKNSHKCILFGLNNQVKNTLSRTDLDKIFVIANDQTSAAGLLKH